MAKKDYSMYQYYKGSDTYPNKKAKFFGFYEKMFDLTYKGDDSAKADLFNEHILSLLYEQASDIYHFGEDGVDKDKCFQEYVRIYREPENNLKQIAVMENYSMYRFYKGEKNNPFDSETDGLSAKFWYYESVFETSFFKKDTSDLYSFFNDLGMGKEFMALLSEEDHDNISEKTKKPVFELWLEYLFEFKMYPEFGGENKEKKAYFSTAL